MRAFVTGARDPVPALVVSSGVVAGGLSPCWSSASLASSHHAAVRRPRGRRQAAVGGSGVEERAAGHGRCARPLRRRGSRRGDPACPHRNQGLELVGPARWDGGQVVARDGRVHGGPAWNRGLLMASTQRAFRPAGVVGDVVVVALSPCRLGTADDPRCPPLPTLSGPITPPTWASARRAGRI